MPALNLLGCPYTGRGIIASNQRAVNIYAEKNNDPQAPVSYTHYPFPGCELFATPSVAGKTRCTYRTSVGTAYVVVGPNIYFLQSNGIMTLVGSIPDRASQVYMADNGLAVILVDGVNGWAIDIISNNFGPIIDPSFYGADFVIFLDTFFVFNRPGTNQFYISLSMVSYALLTAGTSFDPLDIAAKAGSADPIVSIATAHKELWLIGQLTTEVWVGTGAADFYFQIVQGAYINHGCIAPYSTADMDILVFFLMQDKQGKNIVVKAGGYETIEISTPRIVSIFNSYATTSDAIGMCFQINDHAYYLLVFPTDNATWLYDLTTGWWNELGKWNLDTGLYDRYRANCCMFAFGYNLIGDYATGKVYKLNPELFTDGDDIIRWLRIFPHLIGPDFERVIYQSCSLNMNVGTAAQIDDNDPEPQVFLSWSDDKGQTFGNPVPQSLGRLGEFLTDPQWNRLGMGRDRVFKVEWSGNVRTSLNGAYVQIKPVRS
jgi:hypothetical protein